MKKLLLEGGAAGHMMHLYDNPNLTFKEIKDVFTKASAGELEGTEKTDGQNNSLSFDIDKQEAVAVRTADHERASGVNIEGLRRYFNAEDGKRKNPAPESVTKAFLESMQSFETVVKSFPERIQQELFLTDRGERIFYNTEVMATENPNVINYDADYLLIHRVGHKVRNNETGRFRNSEIEELNPKYVDKLIQALNDFQGVVQRQKFKVQSNALIKLKALDDDTALTAAINSIEEAISEVGISDNETVGDYLVARLDMILTRDFGLGDDVKKEVILQLLDFKEKGRFLKSKISALATRVPGGKQDTLLGIFERQTAKSILSEAIWPVELAIHEFAIEMLRALESFAILDNSSEASRIAAEVAKARDIIEDPSLNVKTVDPAAYEVVVKQLQKIKAIEDQLDIPTAAEGFVFDYNGYTYKFTGNFAPVNQILGVFEYGRGGPPLKQYLKEHMASMNTDSKVNTSAYGSIALVPGGFKPPHKGHFQMVQNFSTKCEMVYIIMGTGGKAPRTIGGRTVSYDDSVRIWKLYLQYYNIGNVEFVPVRSGERSRISGNLASPMTIAYDIMQLDTVPGQTVYMGASTKDAGRFKGIADKYIPTADDGNPLINLNVDPFPALAVDNIGELSASKMRAAIDNGEFDVFKEFIPSEVVKYGLADEIWDFLTSEPREEEKKSLTMEYLSSLVEEVLLEKYVSRDCKKESGESGHCAVVSHKTNKQKACYDDCDTARAAMHMNELDYQKSSKITDYVEDREELVGHGGQETEAGGGPYNKKRDTSRAKSGPPAGASLSEVSAMAGSPGGSIEGGMTKSVFPGVDLEKENEEEAKRSHSLEETKEDELVEEVFNYLLRSMK